MAILAGFDSGKATIWTGSSAVIKLLLSRAQLAQMEDLSIRLSIPTGAAVLGWQKRVRFTVQYRSLYRTGSMKCMKQFCVAGGAGSQVKNK
jgi:hypothetical protein